MGKKKRRREMLRLLAAGVCMCACLGMELPALAEPVTESPYSDCKLDEVLSADGTVTTLHREDDPLDGYMNWAVENIVIKPGVERLDGIFWWYDTAGNVKKMEIPSSVTFISENEFDRRDAEDFTIYAEEGSYAHQYALAHGIPVETEKQFYAEDPENGICIFFTGAGQDVPRGTALHTEILTDGAIEDVPVETENHTALYRFSLSCDGREIQADMPMRLYFTLPDCITGKYASFYTFEDGVCSPIGQVYATDNTKKAKRRYDTDALQTLYIVSGHVNETEENDFVIDDGVLRAYLCDDAYVEVPEGVERIAQGAFHCKIKKKYGENVKYVVLPEGLKTIDFQAFYRGTLEAVYIPASVEEIGRLAFAYDSDKWLGDQPITIYGTTLTAAESYATLHKDTFIPVNEQLRGDVNGSGVYEAADALDILRMVVGLAPVYGYSADSSEDGEVTAADALFVLEKVVKLR